MAPALPRARPADAYWPDGAAAPARQGSAWPGGAAAQACHRGRRQALGLGGALGLAMAGLAGPRQAIAQAVVAAGADGPGLGSAVTWPTVRLLDGSTRQAADWQQQVVVVVFFATWCAYCGRHNQRLEQLRQAVTGQPLQVLGVAHDAQATTVRQYLQQRQLGFAVTLDERPLHAALSPRRSVPLTCVVDRQGRLRERIPGEMSEADVMDLRRWLQRA